MGKKIVMLPSSEVDMTNVKYTRQRIQVPCLTGFWLKLFVMLVETPIIGSMIMIFLKTKNRTEMLKNTVIPEAPMFIPEFPPQEPEPGVFGLEEDGKPEERVELALQCLPDYNPGCIWTTDPTAPFRYWKIRDYAYAYRSKLTAPSQVAENFISVIEESINQNPVAPLLISYDPDEVRRQAAASTQRFQEGSELSILDGIFIAVKDDIDCYPYPSKGGTTWFHEVHEVKKDAVCISRLRSCGAVLVGKTNMHELGLGVTGNNTNFGTSRNPHASDRYTGSSSSGSAAIVASGLCSAALGTDGGGSVHIPSSLCGVVGLKTTYGRTDMEGLIYHYGTVAIVGPITATVEDAILMFAAILGSSPAERVSLKPWFNDVFSTDISEKCEDILTQLSEKHGCKTIEIVIPELHEMHNAHIVSIGSEALSQLNPYIEDGKSGRSTYDTRITLALFRAFTATDYIVAQCLSMLKNTVIPEAPMFIPEFPPKESEPGVFCLEEDGKPEERVELALQCLPDYDPGCIWITDPSAPFRYWKIRDYTYAYKSKLTTPSQVAEHFISAIEESNNQNPLAPLLISYDPDDVRRQAAASTQRFKEGTELSILDGIFIAVKDDIDCYPYPSKGGTTWFHELREAKKDAVCVSRLRSCGAVLVGKTNMHELALGTTGNNANFGTTRNPHAPDRYTGGSSSGSAAIVASGLCSAALGTDGGGSIRIPSSLCGVVGLKTTHGRTDMKGLLYHSGTVAIVGPITATVEDAILVYAAILGSSPAERVSLKPALPCLPNLSSCESWCSTGSLRLGKYTEWFNDVFSTEISDKCEDILNQLSEKHGCKTIEIVIPELHEMFIAHLVSIGSEALSELNPDLEDGKLARLTYESRINLALFRTYSASGYVAAQCLRRRVMHFHMEIFKKVDIIVTPTTAMTAPIISPTALTVGETNMRVSGNLMRFVLAGNLLGFPAISVPVGYDKQGLPIGIQLIGRPWCEATILRLAAAIEETCAGPKKKPMQFYDILKGNPM